MIGPHRKNGRPGSIQEEEVNQYGLTRGQVWRIMGTARWNSLPELAKRVIANDLIRQRKACAK